MCLTIDLFLKISVFCFVIQALATVKYFLFCAWRSVKTIYFLHWGTYLSFCLDMVLFPPGESCPGTPCIYFLIIKVWPHQSLAFETLKFYVSLSSSLIFSTDRKSCLQEAICCISLGLLSPFPGVEEGLNQEQCTSWTFWDGYNCIRFCNVAWRWKGGKERKMVLWTP